MSTFQTDHARHLLQTAVYAAQDERRTAFDQLTVALAALAGTPPGRREVELAGLELTSEAVAACWVAGWQPADLHRQVNRRYGPGEVAVLGDALVTALSGHARASVDARWFDQLDEIEAAVWWPAASTWLGARLAARRGPIDTLPALARVLYVLAVLPPIERLGPLPGEAVARVAPEWEGDEKILHRVRALLAKAESTNYPAEAETFTAGAQALMARHSIDQALLAASEPDRRGASAQARRIGIDNPYESPKASLLTAVGHANRCRVVWSKQLGHCTVVGFDVDLQATEALFTSLLVQAVRAMNAEGGKVDRAGRSRTRSFRSSFLTAYAHRIGQRLSEAAQEQTDEAVALEGQGTLLPVLAARQEQVAETFQTMFPQIRQARAGRVGDAEGWHRGLDAANRAAISGRHAVR